MCEIARILAVLTAPAGPQRGVAEQKLPQPESEPLFPCPSGALKQQARGERSGVRASGKEIAEGFVAVKVDEGHDQIWHVF